MNSKANSKTELRIAARQKRDILASPDFASALARHAADLGLAPGRIVGGYHAHKGEADPALLLMVLAERGAQIAFPRVAAKDAALEFHLVPDGEALRPGAFTIPEPFAHWAKVTPDILLVPLLAFDGKGHRLGQGGGYYDRTLAALPRSRAIGIAYAGQEHASLPHDAHDRRLHSILTEKGLKAFP